VILCVAANPSVDRLFAVERLTPGEIHRPAEFAQVPGGKGLNVARSAAALGGEVTAAALLGGHAGRWIAEQLEAEGVPLRAVWFEAETRSSLSVAGAIEGLTEFYEHGHPVSEPEPGVVEERQAREPAQGSADFRCRVADVPHQLGANLRLRLIRNGHAMFAHAIGQKNVAFIRAFFAIRHELAAKGVHVDAAIAGVAERIFAFAKLLFVDGEPLHRPCLSREFGKLKRSATSGRRHLSKAGLSYRLRSSRTA